MINIDHGTKVRKLHNFWNNIHFHPTDAIEDDWGRRILDTAAKDKSAHTVRLYTMLEDIVSRAPDGSFIYDFALNDQRLRYLTHKGFDIFLSYDFIPPCIAKNPDIKNNECKKATRYKGKMIVTSPPADYGEWEEICFRYTEHIISVFGEEAVAKWYLSCYNEPDHKAFFMGDLESSPENKAVRAGEYIKLYRGFEHGIRRASKNLKIGGPSCTSGAWKMFLDRFLTAVKAENLQFDFISVHTYGSGPSSLQSGDQVLSEGACLKVYDRLTAVIDKYFPDIEVVIDEWGASSGGFRNIEDYPVLIFRETPDFAAYYGKMVKTIAEANTRISKMMICLSGQHEMTEDFTGFRNFFTLHSIRKPIYNAFVLMGHLKDTEVRSATDTDGLTVLATADKNSGAVMLAYSSEHFDTVMPKIKETLQIKGISGKAHIKVYVIDGSHTNPYGLCMGLGGKVTDTNLPLLKEEGNLKPVWEFCAECDGTLEFGVSFDGAGMILAEYEVL